MRRGVAWLRGVRVKAKKGGHRATCWCGPAGKLRVGWTAPFVQ